MLLLRELGRAQGYDIARSTRARRLRLNALQRFLIIAEAGLSDTRQGRAKRSGLSGPRRAQAAQDLPATGECFPGAGRAIRSIKKLLGIGPVAQRIKPKDGNDADIPWLLGRPWEGLHAEIMQGLFWGRDKPWIRVAPVGGDSATHYGPAHDADSSKKLRFGIRVTAHPQMDIPDIQRHINCGALIGLRYPKEGAIKGVEVDWDTLVVGNGLAQLREHGTLTPDLPPVSTTDLNGEAYLEFVPKDEQLTGIGEPTTVEGTVRAKAMVLTALGNKGAGLDEALELWYPWLSGFHVALPWQVSFHDERVVLDVDLKIRGGLGEHPDAEGTFRVHGLRLTPRPGTPVSGPARELVGEQNLEIVRMVVPEEFVCDDPFAPPTLELEGRRPGRPFRVSSLTATGGDPLDFKLTFDPGSFVSWGTDWIGVVCPPGPDYPPKPYPWTFESDLLAAMFEWSPFPSLPLTGWQYFPDQGIARKRVTVEAPYPGCCNAEFIDLTLTLRPE